MRDIQQNLGKNKNTLPSFPLYLILLKNFFLLIFSVLHNNIFNRNQLELSLSGSQQKTTILPGRKLCEKANDV
jgi:hypothetical protein